MSQENHGENHGQENEMIPQPHGGALRNGGTNRGGTGRPKSEIRRACAEAFDSRIPRLLQIMDEASTPAEYMKALDLLGKYGGLQQIDATSGDNPLQGLTDAERIERIAALINMARTRRAVESSEGDAIDVQSVVPDSEA
jgi:hypothetical protein